MPNMAPGTDADTSKQVKKEGKEAADKAERKKSSPRGPKEKSPRTLEAEDTAVSSAPIKTSAQIVKDAFLFFPGDELHS